MYDDPDSSFAACRWGARDQLVTVGASPGVEVWDARSAGGCRGPALHCAGPAAGTRYACLAVLPTRTGPTAPHLVAAGAAGPHAAVALWDLRRPVRWLLLSVSDDVRRARS